MEQHIVSMREIQRNYRKLVDTIKRTKQPLYLGARSKAEAVLVEVSVFEDLQKRKNQKNNWGDIKRILDWIKEGGRQDVNLSTFVHEDRKRH